MNEYPQSKEEINAITPQMEKSICRIYTDDSKGSGFFLKINLDKGPIYVLMTNCHVLQKRDEKKEKNGKKKKMKMKKKQ